MTAGVTPLWRGCGHAEIDVDALLKDDRLAAAIAAPVVPGTTERDLRLWITRVYVRVVGKNSTTEGLCALLHRREQHDRGLCGIAREVWLSLAEPEPTSDTGNARRLSMLCGTDIAHDPAAGWRIWAGSSWQSDPDGTVVQRWAKNVSRLVHEEANGQYTAIEMTREEVAQTPAGRRTPAMNRARSYDAWALKSQSARVLADMTKLLRDEPGVFTRADQWDANPRLLACPGATVELTPDGHTIRESRRADRLTKLTKAQPGTSAPAPLWEKFLSTSLPDPDVLVYVQKLLGYGLLAGNPRRLLPIFIGPTSAGKTTCAEIIRYVLGDHAGPFSLALFRGKMDEGPRQDLVKALGRRIIIASEVSARWQLHADEIKRLTGNDSVQARDAYAKESAMVERQPAFMPILCTNHAPTILGADPATWRRLVAVPWSVTVSQDDEDAHLGEKIRTQEADGVLDWLLHGYDMCCVWGLEPPHAVNEATMKLRDSLTIRDQWLADMTTRADEAKETTDDLWTAYRTWCAHGGVPDQDRGSKIGFGRWLGEHPGLTSTLVPVKVTGKDQKPHSKQLRGWKGRRLRGELEDESSETGGFADHGAQ